MATISVTESQPSQNIVKLAWMNIATGDTITSFSPSWKYPVAGCVQFTGTFGGAQVTLEGSNDGTNYVTLKDLTGSNIQATSAGLVEFTTSALHIRPKVTGGTGDSVNVTVVMRG